MSEISDGTVGNPFSWVLIVHDLLMDAGKSVAETKAPVLMSELSKDNAKIGADLLELRFDGLFSNPGSILSPEKWEFKRTDLLKRISRLEGCIANAVEKGWFPDLQGTEVVKNLERLRNEVSRLVLPSVIWSPGCES